MNIVITGGSGFVGKILIDYLLKKHSDIKIINLDLVHSNIDRVEDFVIDITNPIKDAPIKPSESYHLIHLAAQIFNENVPSRSSRKNFFFEHNVNGTVNVLNLFKDNLQSISFLSTDMVYGSPVSSPIREDHPLKPNGEYGLSKIEAEKLIEQKSIEVGCNYYIFRPRLISGPGRYGLLKTLYYFISKGLPVPLIGNGTNRYQFISVFDCVKFLAASINLEASSGIYNIGSQNPPTIHELLTKLINSADSSSFLIKTPPRVTKFILNFLDSVGFPILFPEQFIIADQDYLLDINKLEKEFKMLPEYSDIDMIISGYKSYHVKYV